MNRAELRKMALTAINNYIWCEVETDETNSEKMINFALDHLDSWYEWADKEEAEIAKLRTVAAAAQRRYQCENCGGQGFTWFDVDGEAEADVCDCAVEFDNALAALGTQNANPDPAP